jgi:DNA-3-methyladenine glycosylase I
MTDLLVRCQWAGVNLMQVYHDLEWGTPVHDDRILFEFLILEGAQAGLSWETILKKREEYRVAYDFFDPVLVADYREEKVLTLLNDNGIVRNRLKIKASIENAAAFLRIQAEFGSFDRYIWGFVGGKPIHSRLESLSEIPTSTEISRRMSEDLRRRGFRFVGPTICYAFMQAVGLVNDHIQTCFRYHDLIEKN